MASLIDLIYTKSISPSIIKNTDRNNLLYKRINELDNAYKVSIECDSKTKTKTIKATQTARVINLSKCGSDEIGQIDLSMLINTSQYVFIILIEINEPDYDFESYQQILSNLLEINVKRSVLIDFYNRHNNKEEVQVIGESQNIIKQMLFDSSRNYLKLIKFALLNECNLCLRLTQLINNISDFEITKNDVEDIECNFECFRALLNLPFDYKFNETQVDVYDVLHRSYIQKMKKSRGDAQDIDKDFTSDDFLSDKLNSTTCDALTTLAWRLKKFNIFHFLIQADCAYPKNFIDERSNSLDYPNEMESVQRVENYIEKIRKFHKIIKSGRLKDVEAFVNANRNLIFARNVDNKSALKAAFDSKKMKIFSYLKSMGMFFGDYSEIADHYTIKNQYKKAKKKLIRQYSRMFTKPARYDIIEKLIDRSLVHYDPKVYTNERIISELRRIYTDLNEIISEALIIAAASNQLEIIFDFDNSGLHEFDPSMTRAYGAANSMYDYIIISGLDLIGSDERKRDFALGTVAHELFHHVTYQIYENNYNPYEKNDVSRRKKFDEIFNATRLIKNEDKLIKTVYKNESAKNSNHGELIARIPDILTTHRRNLTYINECKIKFKDLFNYYENEVMKDLRELIPIIGVREKVREFNEWFNVIAEIQEEDGGVIGNDDNEEDENFIQNIDYRLNIVYSSNPKRKHTKIYNETKKLKLLAIFVKSSFGNHANFKKVMYKINTFYPSVLLIIDCDDPKGLKSFDDISDRTTFEKIIVIADNKFLEEIEKLKFYEDWQIL